MSAISTTGARIARWDNGRPAHREQVRLIEAVKLERSSRYLFSEGFITFISKPHDDDAALILAPYRWYSEHLTVMEEPSLTCGALEDIETYRFLWLRSFHNPIVVRIFRRGDVYGLQAAILDGAGGYEPGHVSRRVTKELSRDQWRTVIGRLAEVQLWQMPTRDNKIPGNDGARWVVEARFDGRYHIVDRWNGTDGLESVGRLFLDLAGLGDVGPVY
jgi:hypothetical protein